MSSISPESEAIKLLTNGDIDGALCIAEEQIENASPNKEILWQFEFIRTEALRAKGRSDTALARLELLSEREPADIELRASLKMYRGYCAALLGKHTQARGLLQEALQLASANNLPELVAKVKLRTAFLLFLQEDYDVALNTYQDVADSIGEQFGWGIYSSALSGVGKLEMTLKKFKEAIPWFERSTAIAELHGARLIVAKNWGELAVCYLGLGDPQRSLEFLDRSDAVYLQAGALHSYQINIADRGNVYLYLGDHLKAISLYQRALEIARDIKDPTSIKKWSGNLRIAYAEMIGSMEPASR